MKPTNGFRWTVRTDGYSWQRAAGTDAEDVYLAEPAGFRGKDQRTYEPMRSHGALFRRFADLDHDQDAILAFANEYGRLGGDAARSIPVGKATWIGESLETWARAIAGMHAAVELWAKLQAGDVEGLREHLQWTGTEEPTAGSTRGHSASAPDFLLDGFFREPEWAENAPAIYQAAGALNRAFASGDLIEYAQQLLESAVNKQMQGRVNTRLQRRPGTEGYSLVTEPGSLLGAMWLQLALAIAEGHEFRRCAVCGEWFRLSASGARFKTTYCSTACRMRAYHGRQVQAVTMSEAGVSLHDIASQLETDEKTVAGWLAKQARKEGGRGRAKKTRAR
jgi:hypothetical protein